MSIDPQNAPNPSEQNPLEQPEASGRSSEPPARMTTGETTADSPVGGVSQEPPSGGKNRPSTEPPGRPRILIGSQRDPAAYRPRPGKPVSPARPRPSLPAGVKAEKRSPRSPAAPAAESSGQSDEERAVAAEAITPSEASSPPVGEVPSGLAGEGSGSVSVLRWVLGTSVMGDSASSAGEESPLPATSEPIAREEASELIGLLGEEEETRPERRLQAEIAQLRDQVEDAFKVLSKDSTGELLNRRAGLPPDLEKEFAEALGDLPVEDLITETSAKVKVGLLEPESRHVGRVLAVRGDNVFVELGLREQGVVPLKLFKEPPQPGQSVEVRVVRFVPEEGVYDLVLPAAAADVADWADLNEGMLVEARVVGVNQGGLECEVNRIRGFIPFSQIDIVRVEKPEEYVGQAFTCVVLEADAQRKKLVLSRRAVLEREREQAQQLLWDSLAPGQIRDGVVRRLTEFGAFVDLGGVDGLLHISQIAWGRIKHPGEVLREGQTIKVRIDKVDRENRRISLGYRDLIYNPWDDADKKYVPNTLWKGRVTRLVDFGAFVELEPGIEGLVHISELSLKRVSRVSDVVKVGDEVDVMVLAFDPQEKRISLSIRAALKLKEAEAAPPQAETAQAAQEATEAAPPPVPKKQKPPKPLKGGLGSGPGLSLIDLLKK